MYKYITNQDVLFAFNVWDINSAKAILDAAKQKKCNVILQTSAGVFDQLEKKQFCEFVNSYSKDLGIRAWLHLDHCKEINRIYEAVQCGWDSVMIDASDKTIEENIKITNEVTQYAHQRKVLVEAEIGQVKGVEEDIVVEQEGLASLEDIKRFLSETQVDMIAAAFGNAHGIYTGKPVLHYDLVTYTVQQSDVPFVVHGGSGLSDEILRKLISIPHVSKINISTDVKLAYRKGILQAYDKGFLEENSFQAVQVEKCIHDTIVDMAIRKLNLLF